MKKLHLASLLAATAIAAPFAAQADNQITFNGDLVDVTCTIVGSATGDQAIPLARLAVSAFNTATTALAANFEINVTNCGSTAAYMIPFFANLGSALSINPATGYMKNISSSSAAGGVELQLLNATTTVLPVALNNGVGNQSVDEAPVLLGNAKSKFSVQYVKTGTVTAGAFTSGLTYSLTYN